MQYIEDRACPQSVSTAEIFCACWRPDMLRGRDVHGNGIPMGFPWEREHKYAINGNGKSTRDDGNGIGYFFTCAKIPIG